MTDTLDANNVNFDDTRVTYRKENLVGDWEKLAWERKARVMFTVYYAIMGGFFPCFLIFWPNQTSTVYITFGIVSAVFVFCAWREYWVGGEFSLQKTNFERALIDEINSEKLYPSELLGQRSALDKTWTKDEIARVVGYIGNMRGIRRLQARIDAYKSLDGCALNNDALAGLDLKLKQISEMDLRAGLSF